MSQSAAVRPLHHSMHHDRGMAARALMEAHRVHEVDKHNAQFRQSVAFVAGRFMLSALFLVSAIAKILRFDQTVAVLVESGMDDAGLLLPLAIAVELAGGALLAVGYKARRVAVGLLVYVAGVTLLVSANLSDPLNANSAISNIGFMGALLMIAAHGAGRPSLDELVRRRAIRHFTA